MGGRILVVSGCYDGGLVGLECVFDSKSHIVNFNPLFKFLAHQGSVKSISIGQEILATGGSDETVCLYNINKFVESGYLKLYKGTITSIAWHKKLGKTKNLLVGTEMGKIHVFRAHDLEETYELNAHNGPVYDIAIHPEGKVFITLGKDCKLKLWDCSTNLCVYNTLLSGSPFSCKVSSVDEEFPPKSLDTTEVLTCISFYDDELILLGTKGGSLLQWSFLDTKDVSMLSIGSARVKSIRVIEAEGQILTLTANSKGEVQFWKREDSVLKQIGEYNTQTRLITMQVTVL